MTRSDNPEIVSRELELGLALSILKNRGISCSKPRRYISGTAVSSDEPNSNNVTFIARGLEFAPPRPLLLDHEWTKPLGVVVAIDTRGDRVRFRAEIANNDMPGVDQIWQEIIAGKVTRVSIEAHNTACPAIGRTFSQWRLAEISLVELGADDGARIERVWEAQPCIFLDGRSNLTLYWSTS